MSSKRFYLSCAGRWFKNHILTKPLTASFEITRNCNAKCRHCHLGDPLDETRATPERFGEICREINPLVVQISGGEPLLSRDFHEILLNIHRKNSAPYIVVPTNGSLLTREKYFKYVNDGVQKFSISLDFPDERHDEFRKIPGLFEKISNLMTSLKEEKCLHINLACVIQSQNFRELVPLANLAKKWNTSLTFSCYTTMRTGEEELMLSEDEVSELTEISEELKSFNRKHNVIITSDYNLDENVKYYRDHGMSNCRAGEKFVVVNPDGTLSPCGLIMKSYRNRDELLREFSANNTCTACFTSTRSNTEKPLLQIIADNISMYKQ